MTDIRILNNSNVRIASSGDTRVVTAHSVTVVEIIKFKVNIQQKVDVVSNINTSVKFTKEL